MWLYLPPSCRSAPAAEDSTSGSDLLFQMLERSATWKTKSRPAASWRRVWKTAGWTTRLFGLTYEPSMAQRGVESWISSLLATRASRSATPAVNLAPPTLAISGPTCDESWEKFNRESASSRTSALICDSDSVKSPATFTRWAIELRRDCLQRRKLALLTNANVCSSPPLGASATTPLAADDGSKVTATSHQAGLIGAAAQWQTTAVFQGKYRRQVGQTERTEKLLPAQAESWPSQTASQATGAGAQGLRGGLNLQTAAQTWSTPNSRDWKGEPGSAATARGGRAASLPRDVRTWATPTSRDEKDGAEPSAMVPTNGLLGRQAPRMMRDGEMFPSDSGPRRLNPLFVEWLMGLPEGWTLLVPIASTSSGTA